MLQTQASNFFTEPSDQDSVFDTEEECLIKLMDQRKNVC